MFEKWGEIITFITLLAWALGVLNESLSISLLSSLIVYPPGVQMACFSFVSPYSEQGRLCLVYSTQEVQD